MKAKKKTTKKSVKKSVKKMNALIKRGDRSVQTTDGKTFYLIAGDEKGPATVYELLYSLLGITARMKDDEGKVINQALYDAIVRIDGDLDELKETNTEPAK